MTRGDTTPLFTPCDGPEALAAAGRDLAAGNLTRIPFLAAGRPDLRRAALMAEEVYDGTTRPEPADHGVDLLGAGPAADAVRVLLRPLARRWSTDPADAPAAGRLLVCGLHQDLPSGVLAPLMGYHAPRPGVGVLTGRDLASLSWLAAKQYARVRADVTERALFTGLDPVDSTPSVQVLTTEDFATLDLRNHLAAHTWRSLKFQSHSKDDLLHLGDWGLCGLSDAEAPEGPVTLKPRCGYGHPCPKDADKLIRPTDFRAAELILSGCHSGPFVDAGSYAVRYQLALAAIDGTAQTVVATVTASDAGRREALLFRDDYTPGEDLVQLLHASTADVDPYASFLRYGAAPQAGPAIPPARPPHLLRPAVIQETEELLAISLDRALAWAESDLLPTSHPLRPAFSKFARKYLRLMPRGSAAEAATLRTRLTRDLHSLDRAIAQRLADEPRDAIMDYTNYWADRSVVRTPATPVACGACGDTAQKFLRSGQARVIPDIEVIVCVRCGDGYFRFDGGPDLRTSSPTSVVLGGPLAARVEMADAAPGPLHYGLLTPRYLTDYTLDQPLRETTVGDDGRAADTFTLALGQEIVPQIYYYTAFSVQNLAVSIARHNFGILPHEDASQAW
ncbi:hypothetical protein ACFFTQ_33415 [Streptomyces roseofulvus]|uniref:hypothetical protein n=1 Tax=Streptomyces roseofulvus TaxID=33902 RepID=UPI0031FE1F00